MKENLIRAYFYMNNGVSIINDFRNLGLGIFALYFALKLSNPVLLIVMFLIAIPILIIMGYFNVHHISKVRDRLSVKYGTHYGIRQFELIEEQVALLKQIKKLYEQQNTSKSNRRVKKERA